MDAFTATWTALLSREAADLDLRDADDRGIFRGRVLSATNNMRVTAMRDLAAHLSADPKSASRAVVARAIADAWIARS